VSQDGQATQVSVAGSHAFPGEHAAPLQLSPGRADALHTLLSKQVPTVHIKKSGAGYGAQGRPGRPAGTQTPLGPHTVQGRQLVVTSAQLWPTVRRAAQWPWRQNSGPRQSASPRQAAPDTWAWQVPVLCGSAGSALHDRNVAHGTPDSGRCGA